MCGEGCWWKWENVTYGGMDQINTLKIMKLLTVGEGTYKYRKGENQNEPCVRYWSGIRGLIYHWFSVCIDKYRNKYRCKYVCLCVCKYIYSLALYTERSWKQPYPSSNEYT